jgi:Protein of unknown function (DUF1580)
MIDSASETLLTLKQAADEVPRRRRGRKTHISTLFRWSTVGCRGVVLETIQVGGTRCTSREALQRFFERLSQPVQAGAVGGGQSQPGSIVGHRNVAQRQAKEAGRKLAEPRASGKPPRASTRTVWVRLLNSRTFRAIATGLGVLSAVLRLAILAMERLWRH